MKTSLTLVLLAVFAVFADRNQFEIGNRIFTTNLYKEVVKAKPNENFIFCPIVVQFLMAAFGAADQTRTSSITKEIRKVLNLPGTKDSEYLTDIINDLRNTTDDDFKVFQAMKIYLNYPYSIAGWYSNDLQNVYKCDSEILDFSNANAKNRINEWVSANTNGYIKDFVTNLPSEITSLLVSTLYLSDKWIHPFDPNRNEIKQFHGLNGITKSEMMVKNNQSFYYRETNIAQYIKLQLQRSTLVVGLPLPDKTLQDLETGDELIRILNTFRLTQVDVILPKFKIESDLQMKQLLIKLGLEKPFVWIGDGKLTGFVNRENPFTKVTDILQKSKISVIEQGLEAASASSSLVVSDAPRDLERKTFVADRPFMFYVIYDDLVLFAGRVVNL